MRGRLTPKRGPSPIALYEGAVALAGCFALSFVTRRAVLWPDPGIVLLFLALAILLKREGFRVVPQVTHSLAGVAVLAGLIALGPVAGTWVAALAGLLFLAGRYEPVSPTTGRGRWRLALYGGGLNALLAWGGGALYAALGGRWTPATMLAGDLPPLLALCVAWFLADHLVWSVRIWLQEGWPGVRSFWRAIRVYSFLVELLPLPIAFVLAAAYAGLGPLAFALLALFIVSLGDILRRLNLTLTRSRERVADLTTTNAFSRALLGTRLEVMDLCRLLWEHTAEVADAHDAWLALYDARHDTLEVVLANPEGTCPTPSAELLAWLRAQPVPLRARDTNQDKLPFALALPETPYRSALVIPLQTANGLLGLLVLHSAKPAAYSEDHQRTLVTFANQTALAIQHARSYEAEQRRARQVAAVGEVSRRVAAILGMEQLFGQVASIIRDAFGYYHVTLFSVEPSGAIKFRASTSPRIREHGLPVEPGQGLIGWVAQHGEEMVVADVAAEPRYRFIDGLEETRSEVVVPLKVEERLVGILDVVSDEPGSFGQDDVYVLRTLADQLAIAIEDSRLYQAEKARRQLADTLREMAGAVNSTLELSAVLDMVLTQLRRVIRYDTAAILEWTGAHYCIVAGRGDKYGHPDLCLAPDAEQHLQALATDPTPRAYVGVASDQPSAVSDQRPCSGERPCTCAGTDADGDCSKPAVAGEGTPAAPAGAALAPSCLVVPLRVRDRLIGALILERPGPEDTYGPDEIQVAMAFANQAASAVENAHLYEAEWRRARQLAAIAEVGQRVASILDLNVLFGQVVHLVQAEFGYYHVSIFTRDTESGEIAFRASTSDIVRERGMEIEPGIGIVSWVAEHGQTLVVNDVSADPVFAPDEALPDTRSELATPLLVEERVVGVLDIQSDRAAGFSDEDRSIAETLADQVAVAIENARLYAAQQEEAWVSTALLQVAEALGNLIGIDEVLDAVAHLVPLLGGVDRCLVFLGDEDTGEYTLATLHGVPASERAALTGKSLAQLAPNLLRALREAGSLVPFGIEAGTEEHVSRRDAEPAEGRSNETSALSAPQREESYSSPAGRPLDAEAQTALGLGGGLALPLRAGGEVIGFLVAGQAEPMGRLSRGRRAILTGMANQAAMAIQNAHLYVAQREEAWVSTALLQVSELAGRTKELDDILAGLVRLTPMLVGVDRCLIFLWDRDARRYVPSQAYGLTAEMQERFHGLSFGPEDWPLLDRVRDLGAPIAVEEVSADGLVPPAIARELDIVSVLALPLRAQTEVVGVMLADYAGQPHHFAHRRISLLGGIANQAGIAIENVQLYRESLERERIAQELRVARQIQATFLPESCPRIPGWSIAATSRPAREIGGDFYDFVPLSAHRLGLVIADVSDKGVPAALFMALSRSVMRAMAGERQWPAATLQRVNELLMADSRSGMFVTLFYGILDTQTGRLTYASAGHNPPYLRSGPAAEPVRLVAKGIALGVMETASFEEREVTLEPGDALVLYTDGVTESFDPDNNQFDEEGLRRVIAASDREQAPELMESINEAVQEFARGAHQADDYTMVVVTRAQD